MVSRNNNEICLDKVFKKVKDKQFDYIEKRDVKFVRVAGQLVIIEFKAKAIKLQLGVWQFTR